MPSGPSEAKPSQATSSFDFSSAGAVAASHSLLLRQRFSSSPSTPPNITNLQSTPQLERRNLKRARSAADVDGANSRSDGSKKKRRLRLSFVTSRLSPPFSAPPTYCVSRGSSKFAVWAKQYGLGRNKIHRAAIMNSVRLRHLTMSSSLTAVMSSKTYERELRIVLPSDTAQHSGLDLQSTISRSEVYTACVAAKESRDDRWTNYLRTTQLEPALTTVAKSLTHHQLFPDSPLGVSNYDALDSDDDDREYDKDSDAGERSERAFYSDFNRLDPID